MVTYKINNNRCLSLIWPNILVLIVGTVIFLQITRGIPGYLGLIPLIPFYMFMGLPIFLFIEYYVYNSNVEFGLNQNDIFTLSSPTFRGQFTDKDIRFITLFKNDYKFLKGYYFYLITLNDGREIVISSLMTDNLNLKIGNRPAIVEDFGIPTVSRTKAKRWW